MLVIDQYPATKTAYGRRWFRVLCILLGIALFIVAGWQVWQLVQVGGSGTVYATVIEAAIRWDNKCFRYERAKDVALVLVLVFAGATLVARPKRTVLFLRRFGLDVNFVVSRTFERKLSGNFRLVTLDDERFPSRDLTAVERWSIRIAPPLIAFAIVAIAVPAAADYSRHPGSNFAVGELSFEIEREVGFYVGIFWVAFVFFWAHTLATRRRSRLQVKTGRQLAILLSEVDRSRRWLTRPSYMAPRALVAKVSDKLWQDCVRSLSERVDAIVIDVSEPTQSLKWEIDHLRRVGLKCVFIAERRHLDAWASAAPAADSNKPDSWVFSALAHDRVLVYEGDLPDGGSTFASSLGQLISDAAIGTEKRQISPKNPGLYFRIVRFIRKTLLWGALGLGAGYVGAAIANGAVIWQMQRNDPNLVHLHYPQPLTSIFLDNDFMLDLLFFVLYQDVCEGAWRLERAKELDYLRLEMQIEKE